MSLAALMACGFLRSQADPPPAVQATPPVDAPVDVAAPPEVLVPPSAPPAARCPAPDPAALVAASYAPYTTGGAPAPALLDATCWSIGTRARLEAALDKAAAEGEYAPPGFDPIVDAQDWEVTNLRVRVVDAGTVEASFQNFGSPVTVTWEVVNEGGGWRVVDLRFATGRTLLGSLW